jgi:beta-lactamase regulating signal transducer with metallopeptidase domain
MSELFLTVLNMSLTASYVILIVIPVRLLLKKAPKAVSYALWSVVAFRLTIPFSFESILQPYASGIRILFRYRMTLSISKVRRLTAE